MNRKSWGSMLQEMEREAAEKKLIHMYEVLKKFNDTTRMMKFLKVGAYSEGGEDD